MKRLLQGLALLQLFLVVALAVRTVRVWTTPLPEFAEIPELPAPAPLPPPKSVPKVAQAVTDDIVEHDLFDDQRGQGEDIPVDGLAVDATPVPPPSTVKLMGVMMLADEPVGILLDTNVKPEQQSVRKGEMFGEYEVGDITPSGLMLLGSGGQQFQIPLRIEAGGGGGGAAAPSPARTPGAAAAPRPPPVARPPSVASRPATPRNDAAAAEQKAMSARERAQAIAQRNAEQRKTGPHDGAAGGAAERQENTPDPVQARLEALRQLREAAKGR